MKIINRSNLPPMLYRVLENLIKRDDYTKGAAHLSVTELISSPRIRLLRKAHDHEIERDAADSLWQLVGKAIHKVMEDGADESHTAEQRFFTTVDGVRVSGQIDLQSHGTDFIDINDWKFTSCWSLKQVKKDWEEQLNCYAFLARKNGKLVRHLSVTAVLRDWSRAESLRNPSYPQAPIAVVNIPVWTDEEAERFVAERVRVHTDAQRAHDFGEPLPLCTDTERWQRETKHAVMKDGGKRAVKVFDDINEAMTFKEEVILKTGKPHHMVMRPGEQVRCVGDFCSVSRWCEQYQQYLKTKEQDDGE